MRVRERSAGAQTAVIGCLREASGSVRTAINELAAVTVEDGADLVVETREQLLAAMHLIDGAGVALRRNGL
jgi:hypothetical protein